MSRRDRHRFARLEAELAGRGRGEIDVELAPSLLRLAGDAGDRAGARLAEDRRCEARALMRFRRAAGRGAGGVELIGGGDRRGPRGPGRALRCLCRGSR